MPVCKRCFKSITGFQSLLGYNRKSGRCRDCEREVQSFLTQFRQDFVRACSDGNLSPIEWRLLRNALERAKVEGEEAATFVRQDALHFLEQVLAAAAADGVVTDSDAATIHDLRRDLAIPLELAQPLLARLETLKSVTDVRQGKLHPVNATVALESDELCFMETPAHYLKENRRTSYYVEGRFVATSKRLHFLSPSGSWTIPWRKVMRVEDLGVWVKLELSSGRGNGNYRVSDTLTTQAILETLTRMAKRQVFLARPQDNSRRIPQDVKVAVWQRDQGKCVQCGSTSYLEYDHIIPFSKGGANTVANIQLLCHSCNLKKGSRI